MMYECYKSKSNYACNTMFADLFYTRVAPSKTFDVLKEDFDYYLIVIVLAALLISSYVTKKLASQKVQKQAWK